MRLRRSSSRSFAEKHNAACLALYSRLRHRPGNLLLSPLSLRAALAMAFAGARGETAAQMGEALGFPSSDGALHADFAKLTRFLELGAGGQYEMAVANSLWGQEGEPIEPDFLALIGLHYRGGLELVDFRRQAEAARDAINRWVEERTRGRIRDLVPPGSLDHETRLVLANAVYFKGTWVEQFDRQATAPGDFHLEGGEIVRTPMMPQHAELRYRRGAGFQALELPYRGDDLALLVLLPDRRDGLRDLEANLSARMLRGCVGSLRPHRVLCQLPRFELTWGSVDLTGTLGELGMPLAFERTADFSGINGRAPSHPESLSLARVFHKTFVRVDEEGTEATAATALSMVGAAPREMPMAQFLVDHPFLFAIRAVRSGAVLFLGRVTDPTRAGFPV